MIYAKLIQPIFGCDQADCLDTNSIEEAQTLVRRCAEPRPAGDKVKAAVVRASRRLGFSFSRTKDIWYRDARRIGATEMDQLRRTADAIAIQQSIVSIHTLRNRLIASRSPDSCRIVKAIDDTLSALSRETEGPNEIERPSRFAVPSNTGEPFAIVAARRSNEKV